MKKQLEEILARAEKAHREATETFGVGARIQSALASARADFRKARSAKSLAELLRLRSEAEAVARELGDEAEFAEAARQEVTGSKEAFDTLAASIEGRAEEIRKQLAALRAKYAETLATVAMAGHDPLGGFCPPEVAEQIRVARVAVSSTFDLLLEVEYAGRRARACAVGKGDDSFERLLPFAS
ncbi:hypothetical protein JZU54_00845 [bacterium]|jgi:hypothetical protein|nr:hypothetical protein [bacterium]